MNLTLNCGKFEFNHGEITIREISPLELAIALDYTDTGIIELISAVRDLKGKEFIEGEIK